MITLDRGHLASTHQAAIALDDSLRAWDQEISRGAAAGSVADLVRMLREHGDYWQRVREGRFRTLKRVLARLAKPFFTPQIRYNLLVAECLGRLEVAIAELRQASEPTPGRPNHEDRATASR